MRRAIAALVVAGLAIGVVLFWPRSTTDDPPVTVAEATTTTTTSEPEDEEPTTTTTGSTTTSTTNGTEGHVVETVEEAEAILRELWFGWFEGIYNEDEDRIRDVVGNPDAVEEAVNQFGAMEFVAEPTPDGIQLENTELLLANETCLAIWSEVDASAIVGATNDGVHVFLYDGNDWLFISQWALREDLWEDDCQSQLPS